MQSHVRLAGVALVLAALAGCSDSTGPGVVNGTQIALDFCTGEAPVFLAIRNEDADWTPVQPDAAGTFTFEASPKVELAMVFQVLGVSLTDVYLTTSDELLPLSGLVCPEAFGNRDLSGSVAPLGTSREAEISMSGGFASVFTPATTFTLNGLADGPQDLVAIRNSFATGLLVPERVILRRAINPVSNSTMPELDFGGAESQPIDTRSLTISGLQGGESNLIEVTFSTLLGTFAPVYTTTTATAAAQSLFGIPSALTQAGDRHILSVSAAATDGLSYRVTEHYYQAPSDMAIALRGPISTPVVTSLGTSPYPRYRATVPAQSDYGSFATAFFVQQGADERDVYVTATSGYLGGTPLEWVLDIPDLSGVAGFPSDAPLQSSRQTDWSVEVYSGSLADVLSLQHMDNSTLYLAGTGAAFVSALAAREGGAMPRRPVPSPFRRGR